MQNNIFQKLKSIIECVDIIIRYTSLYLFMYVFLFIEEKVLKLIKYNNAK